MGAGRGENSRPREEARSPEAEVCWSVPGMASGSHRVQGREGGGEPGEAAVTDQLVTGSSRL